MDSFITLFSKPLTFCLLPLDTYYYILSICKMQLLFLKKLHKIMGKNLCNLPISFSLTKCRDCGILVNSPRNEPCAARQLYHTGGRMSIGKLNKILGRTLCILPVVGYTRSIANSVIMSLFALIVAPSVQPFLTCSLSSTKI